MDSFFVGIGYVAVYVRGAKTSGDSHRVLQSLVQRLRREGFSASETIDDADAKKITVTLSYNANSYAAVELKFDKALSQFIGPYYIVGKKREIIQWEIDESSGFERAEDEIYE